MNSYTQVILLCEDIQQDVFVRTFLVQCGIPKKRIRTVLRPKSNAGESFVRREYPREVKAYRQRANRLNIYLVVMIDADKQSVDHHFVELNLALRDKGLVERQPQEKIGIFVPKRNIETWIKYLVGEQVDETTKYPHYHHHEGDCKPLVKNLAKNRHQPLNEDAPSSLKAACNEIPRVLPD